jgi:hypothetical protein
MDSFIVVAAVSDRRVLLKANPRIQEMSRLAVERNPIVEAFVSKVCSIKQGDGPQDRSYGKNLRV